MTENTGPNQLPYKCTEDTLRALRLFLKIDPLPTREKKEGLAKELKLSYGYVDGWLERERKKQPKSTTLEKNVVGHKCTEGQLHKLRLFFKKNPFPKNEEKLAIAEELKLSYGYVDRWLRRERKKHRRRNVDVPSSSAHQLRADSNNNPHCVRRDTLSIEESQDKEIKRLRQLVSSCQTKIVKLTEKHNQTVDDFKKAMPDMSAMFNALYWKQA